MRKNADQAPWEDPGARAIKRVLASQILEAMDEQGLSRDTMARRMEISQNDLDHLLDPQADTISLSALGRAARALGLSISLELI
ncbi:XRE family transcriptional regulator [uncultured Rhodospira sp.]|uniref:XRE family transcriptional regulator n=1 Tax=uncultured Rhodospira sp. TaxID=1936189 RepID=UPI002630615C|nr:XRE family transcriptional regulator [uncultured Rhodospira sp.]